MSFPPILNEFANKKLLKTFICGLSKFFTQGYCLKSRLLMVIPYKITNSNKYVNQYKHIKESLFWVQTYEQKFCVRVPKEFYCNNKGIKESSI